MSNDTRRDASAGGRSQPAGKEAASGAPRASHRRILAVVNPVSGPVGSQNAARDLKERAEKSGLKLEVVETTPELNGTQAVEQAVRDAGEGFDCYLAVGGDGTVMEVATAAMKDKVPLAIMPRGTANAVAWTFSIPFDMARALKVATQGRIHRIDVARTRQRDFLIVAGLGYDAHVIKDATRVLKRRLGFLAYLYAALKNIGRRPYSFRVALDDEKPFRVRGASALVTNTGTLAGNIRVVKEVTPHDGLLDLVVMSPATFANFFRMVFLSIFGRLHEDPRVRYYQAAKIKVECRPAAPLEIDGDEIDGTFRELSVEVLPRALTLMVPPEDMSKVPWVPEVPWPPGLPKKDDEGKSSEKRARR